MVLSQAEIDICQSAFSTFDRMRTGKIVIWDLSSAMEAIGRHLPSDQIYEKISEVDVTMTGSLNFSQFLCLVEKIDGEENIDDESEMIDAFVACGGTSDKSGFVSRETLVKIMESDFGLTVNVENVLRKIGSEHNGDVEYPEFKMLLS